MIKALDRIQTESRHQVSTNADAARSEIMSLNGANTSSTHTIYVRKVEANATGGLVGGGVRRFADGGAVAPAFPRMSGGSVPGSGHHDTVPRTLEARGLDVNPALREKLAQAGDLEAAAALDIILRDEIGHVEAGNRWYKTLCAQRGCDPVVAYADLAQRYRAPAQRGPFNLTARKAAGFTDAELDALLAADSAAR